MSKTWSQVLQEDQKLTGSQRKHVATPYVWKFFLWNWLNSCSLPTLFQLIHTTMTLTSQPLHNHCCVWLLQGQRSLWWTVPAGRKTGMFTMCTNRRTCTNARNWSRQRQLTVDVCGWKGCRIFPVSYFSSSLNFAHEFFFFLRRNESSTRLL